MHYPVCALLLLASIVSQLWTKFCPEIQIRAEEARNLQSRPKRVVQEVVYTPFHCNLSIFSKVSKNHVHLMSTYVRRNWRVLSDSNTSIPLPVCQIMLKPIRLKLTNTLKISFVCASSFCQKFSSQVKLRQNLRNLIWFAFSLQPVRGFQICISLNLSQYLATLSSLLPSLSSPSWFHNREMFLFIPILQLDQDKCKTWSSRYHF